MRKKIAIIHPQLKLGGSESVALWVAEVLKKDYDLSLISGDKADLGKLNEYYGTDIKEGEIKTVEIKAPRLFKNRFDALRSYRLARFAKKVASDFDIVISTYNVMDFGKKGIQFIADLSFNDELRRMYDPEPNKARKWLYEKSFLRKCYLKLAENLSGTYEDGWKKNITISNSCWTKQIIEEFYKIKSGVIYPCIAGDCQYIAWMEKKEDFVCLGRISPEKQVEKIIEIVKEVRKTRPSVNLHIIGKIDDPDYAKKVQKICGNNKDWCFFEGPMYGQDKLNFIARYKYGISGRSNEPFGIAVAEMVNAGCIVFAPNGGGQTEIVNDSALIYDNINDAVKKIEAVLCDTNAQENLRVRLAEVSHKFSIENFKKSIIKIVNDFTA
ncbi:MAG: glycosyltransferase family 4 protein [Candidatus Staskawiczbacteria bacterium]|nr:glycosyltransferase family 4 protein [Candidatus Staskawiczbacteria bacterium]